MDLPQIELTAPSRDATANYNTGNFTQEEFAASIYAAYRNGLFWGDIIGSAGTLHDGVNRSVPIGITVQPNNGNTNGTNCSLALRAGYDFMFAGLTHGPLAGIVLQRVHVGSFTESGGFTSLAFDDTTSTRSLHRGKLARLLAHAERNFEISDDLYLPDFKRTIWKDHHGIRTG
jgi:uncharacterized protein YhjY with autotransporter beta-barrel domain